MHIPSSDFGYPKSVVIDEMVKLFWFLAQKNDLNPWFGRVGTDYNPSDMPARHVALPCMVMGPIQSPQLTTPFFNLFKRKPDSRRPEGLGEPK